MFLFFQLEYQRTFFPCVKLFSHDAFGLQYEMVRLTKIWVQLGAFTGPCFRLGSYFSRIRHYHISHDTPCRPLPPEKNSGENTVFLRLSCDDCNTWGKWETKAMQNLGANKVYYERNANWELSLSYDVTVAILVFQNGAMLVVLKNPLWVEHLFLCKSFFCSNKLA